jgi:hypothetical protein
MEAKRLVCRPLALVDILVLHIQRAVEALRHGTRSVAGCCGAGWTCAGLKSGGPCHVNVDASRRGVVSRDVAVLKRPLAR